MWCNLAFWDENWNFQKEFWDEILKLRWKLDTWYETWTFGWNIKFYIKSYIEGGRTSPTLSQVHISPISSPLLWACEEKWTWNWTYEDLKLDLWTWVKIAQGALGSQVLRSQACEAEENLTAKGTKCNCKQMSMKRQPSTPSRACDARCT